MFHALKHRNFRIYTAGQFISFVGTWMQQLATGWLIFHMTNSPLWLGISGFSSQIPMFLLAFFAGVYVDQVNKLKLLKITQSLAAIQALALAALTLTGKINLPELIIFNLILGTITTFDMTARQAFLVQMVKERKDLPNAIAINSTVINATRLIGPAMAGIAISVFNEGFCFLINGISYVAVLIALYVMEIEHELPKPGKLAFIKNMRVGFSNTFEDESIRTIIIFLSFMSLIGLPYNTVFPAMAVAQFGGNAHTLAWISSASGLGTLLGALYLAKRTGPPLLGRRVAKSALQFSVALVCVAFVSKFAFLLVVLLFAGMGMMIMMAGSNTVIQTIVDDDKRGRTLSFFNFSLMGISPFGNLLFGWAASRFGLPHTFLVMGSICVVGSIFFLNKSDKINVSVRNKMAVM